MTSTRLLEVEPAYNQGQDATTSNQKGYKQVKRGDILQ